MTDPKSAASTRPLNPFGAVPRANWRAKVEADLRGRPFASLERPDAEGLARQVLYTLEDAPGAAPVPGVYPYLRGPAKARARIAPRIEAGAQRSERMRVALELGAQVLWIEGGEAPPSEGDASTLWIADADAADAGAGSLADLLAPIYAARSDALDTGALARALAGADRPALLIDLRPVHEAGGGPVEVLRAAFGAGVAVLRAAEAADLALEAVAARCVFAFAAGLHFFDAIATLRAARAGWAEILHASGVAEAEACMQIRVDTSRRELSGLDPWLNVLRASTQVLAAQMAGADYLGVDAFVADPGQGETAWRMAVNTAVVTGEESHAAAVADPAGGSHQVEARSEQLLQAAWAQFAKDESAGGWLSSLVAGEVETRAHAAFEAQSKALAQGRQARVGTTRFPERGFEVSEVPRAREYARMRARRSAAAFEALRARAGVVRPRLGLLGLGALRDYKARADFGRDFLATGGIELEEASSLEQLDALVSRLEAGEIHGVLVAGSDEAYLEAAPRLAAAAARGWWSAVARPDTELAELGPVLAARVHMKADLVATASALLDALGGER